MSTATPVGSFPSYRVNMSQHTAAAGVSQVQTKPSKRDPGRANPKP